MPKIPLQTIVAHCDKILRTREIGDYIRTVPETTDYQMYVGTAAPYNFNGLVRHYYMRRGPNVADIRFNMIEKGRRAQQSHAVGLRLRKDLKKIAHKTRLSPILLVRGDIGTGRALQIADGYHRLCASYHVDEDTEIPCRLVDLPLIALHPPR